tara:strand:- start:5517 stop:6269 length:753 start_codon:yes stop_codon:yes gene_type:complete
MLDYKELSNNPYHLNKYKVVDEVMDEVVRGAFEGDWRTDDFLHWLGSPGLSGKTDPDEFTNVKDAENIMIKDLSQLTRDSEGNPVLTKDANKLETLKGKRGRAVSDLFDTSIRAQDKKFGQLYKMGVRGHGAMSRMEKELDESTQRKFKGITEDYSEDLLGLEDEAIKTLEEIETSVTSVPEAYRSMDTQSGSIYKKIGKNLYKPGEGYETKGAFEEYNVPTLGGPVNPEEIIEKAFQHDYTTGKPRKTT